MQAGIREALRTPGHRSSAEFLGSLKAIINDGKDYVVEVIGKFRHLNSFQTANEPIILVNGKKVFQRESGIGDYILDGNQCIYGVNDFMKGKGVGDAISEKLLAKEDALREALYRAEKNLETHVTKELLAFNETLNPITRNAAEAFEKYGFKISSPELFDRYYRANANDPYSKATVDYAIRCAKLMEEEMASGAKLKDIVSSIKNKAHEDGISGQMFESAKNILFQTWEFGPQLEKIFT